MTDKAIEELIIVYLEEKLSVLVIAKNIFSPFGIDCHEVDFKIATLRQVLIWVREEKL